MSKTSKSNYKLTRKDQKIMSLCMKSGYKIFPDFLTKKEKGVLVPIGWVRHNPLVILVSVQNNRRKVLMSKPFDQRYLTHYTTVFYKKFYEGNIINENKSEKTATNRKKKIMFPAPPPLEGPAPPP